MRGNQWAIVLAGGCGERLARLTSAGAGRPVPKQYWSLRGGRSLLGDALARAERLVPRERMLVVVAQEHEEFWARELDHLPLENVLAQPANRGTAAGLVLPLLAVLARDPWARVLALPSDHHVEDEAALSRAFSRALAEAAAGAVALVGVEPDAPETQYGWILPEEDGEVARVRSFVEKPPRELAGSLMRRGALWNTFLLAADGRALVERVERSLEGLPARLWSALAGPAQLEAVYRDLPSSDASRDVLQADPRGLLVVRAPACGWTDLGPPERVRTGLARAAARPSAAPAPSQFVLESALQHA